MAGQHQIHAGRRLGRIVMGLMVQDYAVLVRVQACGQFFHRSPWHAHLILRAILPPDQVKLLPQQHDFILQYPHTVLLQLRHQVGAAVSPVCRTIIPLVMVSEDIVNPIGGLQASQRRAGGFHVLFGSVIIHEIPCHHHDIRMLRLHVVHPSLKALPAESIAHMGIRKLYDAQTPHRLLRLHYVRFPPNMIRQIPSADQICCRDAECEDPGVILCKFLPALLFHNLTDSVAHQPHSHQVQDADGRVDCAKACPDANRQRQNRNDSQEKRQKLLFPGDSLYDSKLSEPADQIQNAQNRAKSQCAKNKCPHLSFSFCFLFMR